ncbi:hypothetical protein AMECASPLE_006297 [Ameca splendens]|uniref:Uncharacterized protein n=1 Tax=Ameca splendens TaxID=208324 RepID=A0ABV0YLG3_9TELE
MDTLSLTFYNDTYNIKTLNQAYGKLMHKLAQKLHLAYRVALASFPTGNDTADCMQLSPSLAAFKLTIYDKWAVQNCSREAACSACTPLTELHTISMRHLCFIEQSYTTAHHLVAN